MKPKFALAAVLMGIASTPWAAINVQFDPGADPGPYRKVLIEPAQVQLHREYLQQRYSVRGPAHRPTEEKAAQIASEYGERFRHALGEAFRARGFEVVSSPAPGVLRITPTIRELYINAPPGADRGMMEWYARDAGFATLSIEGRDPAGSRVVRASEQRVTAGMTDSLRYENESSIRQWFNALFERWADKAVLAVAQPR
jgi:hypothetical protein